MELQLVGAGQYEAECGHDFPLHVHTTWEIVLYRAGSIQTVVGTESYATASGMIVATPPGVPHAEYALTSYANYYLGIQAPVHTPWPRTCMDDADQQLAHVCRSLVIEWNAQRTDRVTMLNLLLQQLDLLLRRAAGTPHPSISEKLVTNAERYMQEQYHRPLSIGEIAAELGVSPSTLRLHFVRVRGDTPMVALQRLRAQRACELLRTSDLTLEAIARVCGYDSASHLSRQIKKFTGARPGMLRSSLHRNVLLS